MNGGSMLFQFHKGSIKRGSAIRLQVFLFGFQFHKGSIKRASSEAIIPDSEPYFNSTKVQLKVLSKLNNFRMSKFQFHKGSIKSFRNANTKYFASLFQFHKGSIKRVYFKAFIFFISIISIPQRFN